MTNHEELVEALTRLDVATLEQVVTTAYRRRADLEQPTSDPPAPGATPEEYAGWLARRHLATDGAIEQVVYLPTGAPKDEIRLLEVNRFLDPTDRDAIEPLDFTPETGLPYRVFVADVTTDQWGRLKQGRGPALPAGWDLADNEVFGRA
jgi:hypothetical protein